MQEKIDDIDKKILAHLRDDCRIPFETLADKLDIHKNTVSQRIRKLEESGYILGYQTIIDMNKIGFKTTAIIEMTFKNAFFIDQKELADIISIPQISIMGAFSGTYNVIAQVKAKNENELREVLSKIKRNKHLLDMRFELVTKTHKFITLFNPFSLKQKTLSLNKEEFEIKKFDLEILQELLFDAKKSNHEIAKKLGISQSAVNLKINRMKEQNVILGMVAELNLPKLGFSSYILTKIKFEPKEFHEQNTVDKIIQTIPEVFELRSVTGCYDMYGAIVSTGAQNNLDILSRFQNIPSISKFETQISFTALKLNSQYKPSIV